MTDPNNGIEPAAGDVTAAAPPVSPQPALTTAPRQPPNPSELSRRDLLDLIYEYRDNVFRHEYWDRLPGPADRKAYFVLCVDELATRYDIDTSPKAVWSERIRGMAAFVILGVLGLGLIAGFLATVLHLLVALGGR